MSITFIKEAPDRKGRIDIIEGTILPGQVFSIERFICAVTPQLTPAHTEVVADMIVAKLKDMPWLSIEKAKYAAKFLEDGDAFIVEDGEEHGHRTICQVQEQETPEDTAQVAELLLNKLNV